MAKDSNDRMRSSFHPGRILIATGLLVLCSMQAAGEAFVTEDDFAVLLPLGWTQAPPKALRNLEAAIKAMSKGTSTQKYDYGFQLASAKTWFEYPYILMRVNRGGRIPEGELSELTRIRTGLRKGLDLEAQKLSQIVSGSSQGDTVYDENEHVLWSAMSANFEGVGKVRILVAMKLTEYGFVQVMGYATEDGFADFTPIFRAAVRDLVFAKAHEYQPSITDHAPRFWGINFGKVAIALLVGSAVGGGAAWVIRFLKSRRNRASEGEHHES